MVVVVGWLVGEGWKDVRLLGCRVVGRGWVESSPAEGNLTFGPLLWTRLNPQFGGISTSTAEMEAEMTTATILIALHDAGLSLQNATARARNQFVQQTSLVIRGIRAGYLVDALPFPQRKLDSWFRALTARLPNTDKDFAILHEDTSDSFFFVNRILLLDNFKSGSVPIWVNTDNSSIQVSWNEFPTSMCRDPTL